MPKQVANAKKSGSPPSSRRKGNGSAYHHGDLRQAFKDAALEVLAGPDAHLLSFRDLTRRLGVTTGAPYHHFKDRTDLLVKLAIDGFNLLHRRLEQASTGSRSNDSLVQALTVAYLDFAHEERGYYQAMFLPEVCAVQDVSELRQAADESFQLVCKAIARMQGELAEEEVSERAVSLWSFLHGVINLRAAGTLGRRLSSERENKFAVEAVKRLLHTDRADAEGGNSASAFLRS